LIRKWIKRIVLGAIILLLLVIGGALIFLHTDYGRDFARRKAETTLISMFPGGAKIGRIEGSVLGTLVIDDLVLNGRDGKPFISVGTARVKIALTGLLSKTVRIDRLDLEDVTFDKHPQPERPPEVPPTPSEAGGSPWTVEIPHATVRRGHVLISSASRRILEATDLDVEGSIGIHDGISIAAHALGSAHGKPLEATALLSYVNETLAFPLAVVRLDQANVFALAVYVGPHVDGVIRANVPAETAKLLADVTIPGDASLVVTALAGKVDAKVTMQGASVRALLDTDLVAKSAKGLIIAEVPDGTRLDPRIAGSGIVTAAVDASSEHVRGMISVDGLYRVNEEYVGKNKVHATSLIALDAALNGAWVFLESGADIGTTRATAIAEVTKQLDGGYALAKSTLIAATRRVGARKTDLAIGSITASLRASGPLYPKPAIKVSGSIGGDAVRFRDISVATVDISVNAANISKQLAGHIDLGTVMKGPTLLGSANLDAHGSIKGGVTTIDLDQHAITTASEGTWNGSGGHIVIDADAITVSHFHTGSAGSTVTADVGFVKATKDLTAKIDAQQVALESLAPNIKGLVGAKLDISRHGGRWAGKGHFTAEKLAIPKQPVIDAELDLEIKGRRVILDGVTTADAGAISLAADVEGPYDLTDVKAWKRLDRKAINEIGVGVSKVDLSKLGRPKLVGIVDGKLGLTASNASGDLHISQVTSDAGVFSGDITFKPDDRSQIDVGLDGHLDELDFLDGGAKIALPTHPFDPKGWQELGKRALKSADITIKPVDITPALLAKVHLDQPYSARVQSHIVAAEGADSITVTSDVNDLVGGHIKQPIAVHSETTIDGQGVHTVTNISSRNQTLMSIEATTPVTLETLDGLKRAKLDGTISIPDADAADFVAVVGRGDVVGGKIGGKFKIGGVMEKPTAEGKLTLQNVEVAPSISGRKAPVLHDLELKASYDGELAKLDIIGNETKSSTLKISAQLKPTAWKEMTASIQAVNFDIAPAMAFLPGALSAAKGTITASLQLKGLDPDTGDVEGRLVVNGGRYPLSPLLGTLRAIEAEINVANHKVTITKVDGKLGKGTVHATGSLELEGAEPRKLHIDGLLTDISLIRAMQPTINATLAVDLTNNGAQFTGDIVVSRAKVSIVSSGGASLLEAGSPSDMVFVDEGASISDLKLGARQPPTKPWLLATVDIKPTELEILQEQFQIRGSAKGSLSLSLGQGSVGLDGTIEATRGDINLLGTQSQLERGEVIFDGTPDPLLNIRVVRELDTMNITAQVSGRASKPEVQMSADQGNYTQGELYTFFLGGQSAGTNGDATQAGYAAGAGYGSALLSNKINKALKLPVRIDFNYEVATATSSDGVRVGAWFSPRWLCQVGVDCVSVASRTHPHALIDENRSEALLEWHLPTLTAIHWHNVIMQVQVGTDGYQNIDLVRRWNW
jgi:hypothetical protein